MLHVCHCQCHAGRRPMGIGKRIKATWGCAVIEAQWLGVAPMAACVGGGRWINRGRLFVHIAILRAFDRYQRAELEERPRHCCYAPPLLLRPATFVALTHPACWVPAFAGMTVLRGCPVGVAPEVATPVGGFRLFGLGGFALPPPRCPTWFERWISLRSRFALSTLRRSLLIAGCNRCASWLEGCLRAGRLVRGD